MQMKQFYLLPNLIYATIAGVTITIGIVLWTSLDTLSYQMVALFITLIVLSNCFAKLVMLHVYKQNP